VESDTAETIGYACLTTGTRPRDVLQWTRTEQQVAAMSGMAVMRSILSAYAEMWDG